MPAAGPAVNFNSNITVNAAQGGDAKANQDAADRTAKAVEAKVRAIVGSELANQLRPGGTIYHAARGGRR